MSKDIFETIMSYRAKPPVDLYALCDELNICVFEDKMPEFSSGSIFKSGGGYCDYTITVNQSDPTTRKRFTIAHEIGHYLYHRKKIGDGITDDRLYRNYPGRQNSEISNLMETEANQFAAYLLMPDEHIAKMHNGGLSPERIAAQLVVSEQALKIKMDSMKQKGAIVERQG